MKHKYKICLILIGLLLTLSAIFGIGYGVWINTRDDFNIEAQNLDCFKIYLDSYDVNMKNIQAITSEEGKKNSPYSLTVTNICDTEKRLQVRLVVLDETTVDLKSLTINATGNIKVDEKFYTDLDDAKTNMQNSKISKLIDNVSIEPNETIRTNIKIWFDEKKNPTIEKEDILVAKFELIDGDAKLGISLKDKIKSLYTRRDNINLTETATKDEGLLQINYGDNTYYYFRGAVKNNYLTFAGFTWRIVGLNPDGTTKIILSDNIGNSKFGDSIYYKDYVGLTYNHSGRIVDNNIQQLLNNWYTENIINTNLDRFVSEEPFCNDTSYVMEKNKVSYGGYNRVIVSNKPSLLCPERTSDFGGVYNQKIGLITADEVIFAGGLSGVNNETYYLNNGTIFYTLTPSEYSPRDPQMIAVTDSGAINTISAKEEHAIRPVLNLANTTVVTGAGTESNPYIIDINN